MQRAARQAAGFTQQSPGNVDFQEPANNPETTADEGDGFETTADEGDGFEYPSV